MSPEVSGRMPFIEIGGSPREVGAALGRFGRDVVHDFLLCSPAWKELTDRRADPRLERMAAIVRDRHPRYWAELEGLAEGLELPFDDVFLWNCRGDIWAMAPDGCTTVQLPGSPHVIGHNEDGDPGFAGHSALAHIASDSGNSFTAFVYPGSLPGHTFAATSAGLVQTVNNIRPLGGGSGTPRMILARAVLDAPDLDAALRLVNEAPRAGAFHLTLAQAGDPRLLGVEFTAEAVSIVELRQPGVHANHLIHEDTLGTPQVVTGSSGSRQERGSDLLGSVDLSDRQAAARRILWDTSDARLPIYRTDPQDEDVENTLASVVFAVGPHSVTWSVYDRAEQPPRFEMRNGLLPSTSTSP